VNDIPGHSGEKKEIPKCGHENEYNSQGYSKIFQRT
jgi:hypothetical protein